MSSDSSLYTAPGYICNATELAFAAPENHTNYDLVCLSRGQSIGLSIIAEAGLISLIAVVFVFTLILVSYTIISLVFDLNLYTAQSHPNKTIDQAPDWRVHGMRFKGSHGDRNLKIASCRCSRLIFFMLLVVWHISNGSQRERYTVAGTVRHKVS